MNRDHGAQLLARFKDKQVAVLGDLMLDRYIFGGASRISQEAPVPVVVVNDRSATPGGAANVLRNLATLGAKPIAFGLVGDDSAGRELVDLLTGYGVDSQSVLKVKGRPTTEKARIIARNQQVVRLDTEETGPLGPEEMDRLVAAFDHKAAEGALSGLIVEDYAKGLISEEGLARVWAIADKHDIPVAFDPHPANVFRAPRLLLATPNRAEAFALTGTYYVPGVDPVADDAALAGVARKLHDLWNVEHLLITLGSQGMALFTRDEPVHHVPTRAQEVFDVSGAGDTVIASFMLALLGGATAHEACIFANHAAGVVVGKLGTAPIFPEEVIDSFDDGE